jgi:hypothetical protein
MVFALSFNRTPTASAVVECVGPSNMNHSARDLRAVGFALRCRSFQFGPSTFPAMDSPMLAILSAR